jgi:hypothetical protein
MDRLPANYAKARKALALATRVDQIKQIRDKAMAVRLYARQANDTALMNDATDLAMRAEIKAGRKLIEMAKSGERKGDGRPTKRSRGVTVSKLSDLGITKMQSSRWQALARLPDRERERRIERAKRLNRATIEGNNAVIAEARRERHELKARMRAKREREWAGKIKALPQKRYGVILADPEWQWETWSEKALGQLFTSKPLRDLAAGRDKSARRTLDRRRRLRAVPVGDSADDAAGVRRCGSLGLQIRQPILLGEEQGRDWLLESKQARTDRNERESGCPRRRFTIRTYL